MASRFEELRSSIVAQLRQDVQEGHARRDGSITPRFTESLSEDDATIVWSVFHDLVRQGLIVPGGRASLAIQGGTRLNFPSYSVTPFGATVLGSPNPDFDPQDGEAYVQAVKAKIPGPLDLLAQYLAESVATYRSQHFLASAILLGVASEDLLERLYRDFEDHLPEKRRPAFKESLYKKRGSAEGRFDAFWKSFEHHLGEIGEELRRRAETHLTVIKNILKFSRDDVGHSRPSRVSRDIAHMNLVSFPVLVGIVAELEASLQTNCTLT